jgi:hypothetical protein
LEEWQLDGGMDNIAKNNSVELYNLKYDIGERNNLVLTEIKKRDYLLNELLEWQKAINAPLPTKENDKYQH